MKQLFYLTCMLTLFACHTVKKTNTTTATHNDSTTVKKSVQVQTKSTDSTGRQKLLAAKQKKSSNEYKKTTTVKEYFGEEFDFEGEDTTTHAAQDSTKRKAVKAPGLRYRETVIEETGKGKQLENALTIEDNTAQIKDTASNVSTTDEKTNVSNGSESQATSTSKFSFLSLWWLWLLLVLIALALYYKFKL